MYVDRVSPPDLKVMEPMARPTGRVQFQEPLPAQACEPSPVRPQAMHEGGMDPRMFLPLPVSIQVPASGPAEKPVTKEEILGLFRQELEAHGINDCRQGD